MSVWISDDPNPLVVCYHVIMKDRPQIELPTIRDPRRIWATLLPEFLHFYFPFWMREELWSCSYSWPQAPVFSYLWLLIKQFVFYHQHCLCLMMKTNYSPFKRSLIVSSRYFCSNTDILHHDWRTNYRRIKSFIKWWENKKNIYLTHCV